ncbi:phosphatidylglycerophosphatase B [Legionella busanensis]|uniref:undecaprenyl-diphosphate phosphatase n=1 Tax=Legionella busanensis TaxID=190655 RepID=A0A378JP02_9GAMM|nr:phosphatase PAP2 family protein [Legionella busanensis]STX52441.1 phosphatidylglycerophosphatase B [Legionella busanensis]
MKKNYFLFGGILCLGLFFALALTVFYRASFLSIDKNVYLFVDKIQSSFIFYASNFLSLFGNKYIIISTIAVASMILYLKQQKHLAIHLFGMIFIATILASILKITIAYPRPNAMPDQATYAFPSRHSTLCTAYVTFLLALLAPKIKHIWFILTLSFIFILLVLTSRLFLKVHWLTDVIGGFLLGGACGLLGAYSFYLRPEPINNVRLLLITLLLTFIIFSACFLILMTYIN